MNASQTKVEIAKTEDRLAELGAQQERLDEARRVLVVAESDYDQALASELEAGLPHGELFTVRDQKARRLLEGWDGRGLRAIERDLAGLTERRDLLEEQLPSAEQVAEAEKQAAGLVKRATEQSEQFEQSWSAFLAALAEAEAAGRQVVATRSEAQATMRELLQLRDQYGLDVEVPREPKPTTADSKAAGITGSLLQSVGYSQVIERGLDAELASARRRAEREAA